MILTAMESLAESKARKRASLIDDDKNPKNSKKRRSSGSQQQSVQTIAIMLQLLQNKQ